MIHFILYETVFIMLFLVTKHFIVDFLIQTPYQWQNKGTYGHPGGILHAGLHGVATMIILSFFVFSPLPLLLGIFDAVVHYHIDWGKMKINEIKGWKADKDPQFWWLLGLDQFLHYLTYVIILFFVI